MRRLPILCALSLFAASASAFAQSGHRQLGTHEHGAGILNIAVDGKSVGMELQVPGADIVGFEHAATTDDQKARLAAAKEKLGNGLALFRLPDAAGCRLTGSKVDYATEDHGAVHSEDEAGKSLQHDDHGHGHHAHDHASHGQASHEGDGHDSHEEHGHDHDHAQHAEFRADYSIECDAPADLRGLVLDAYFNTFNNAERLQVNLVTENGQSSHQATRSSAAVSFAP